MDKEKYRKLTEFPEETQPIHEFLIQMQDQEGTIKEKVLRLKYAITSEFVERKRNNTIWE